LGLPDHPRQSQALLQQLWLLLLLQLLQEGCLQGRLALAMQGQQQLLLQLLQARGS
jgi:hypothetical protein